ncbi:MAG: ribose-phosphate pyrophosphokinase [Candidatus Lokiarchaeota archaeon]|nr:ribose-phosphate pyrophosphokinase [Candidatus Lokiarchaeota archaeon]
MKSEIVEYFGSEFKTKDPVVYIEKDETERLKGKNILYVQSLYPDTGSRINDFNFTLDLLFEVDKKGNKKIDFNKLIIYFPVSTFLRSDARYFDAQPNKLYANAITVFGKYLKPYIEKFPNKIIGIIMVDAHLHRYNLKELSETFGVKIYNVSAIPPLAQVLFDYISDISTPILIAPDEEADQWAAQLRNILNSNFKDVKVIQLYKHRWGDGQVSIIESSELSLVTGKTVIIYDDMIGTGGTLIRTIERVKDYHPAEIIVLTTHLYPMGAQRIIKEDIVSFIITTNTINRFIESRKIKTVSLGRTISKIVENVLEEN